MRDLTLKSTAPTLVYEEGSLVKRSIRDLYNKDIDEVIVAGDDGLPRGQGLHAHAHAEPCEEREALPRHASRSSSRYGIESQLDAMFSPTVQLRSGGYIVINQTEALVAIDVNSGRATREHHIEDTALKTNLEASEEIARQLRLRDLAGLIVIDFIDMDEKRNNRSVERRLKECLKQRPRPHPGRPHLAFRPAGNVAPAHPHQRAGKLDREMPALRRHRPCPLGVVGRAAGAARARGDAAARAPPTISSSAPGPRSRSTCSTTSARICAASKSASASRSRSTPTTTVDGAAGLRDRPRRAGAHRRAGHGARRAEPAARRHRAARGRRRSSEDEKHRRRRRRRRRSSEDVEDGARRPHAEQRRRRTAPAPAAAAWPRRPRRPRWRRRRRTPRASIADPRADRPSIRPSMRERARCRRRR